MTATLAAKCITFRPVVRQYAIWDTTIFFGVLKRTIVEVDSVGNALPRRRLCQQMTQWVDKPLNCALKHSCLC